MPAMSPAEELQAWMSKRSFAIGHLALNVLGSAEEVLDLLTTYRFSKKRPHTLPKLVPIGEWLPLYKDHRRLERFFAPLFGFDPEGPASAARLRSALTEWDRMLVEDKKRLLEAIPPEELVKFAQEVRKDFDHVSKELFEFVAQKPKAPDASEDKDMMELFRSAEMQFFLWIWLPCWVHYGKYATKMFWKARCGDLDELEELLRIDKSIVHDRLIAELIHQTSQDPGSGKFRRIKRGFAAKPRSVDIAKVKKRLGAMVIELSHRMKQPVDEGDIRHVYDLLARLKAEYRDNDIPAASDTFSKAIRRERAKLVDKLGMFENPDKNQ